MEVLFSMEGHELQRPILVAREDSLNSQGPWGIAERMAMVVS